jgi:hypothetical protein
MGLAALVTLSGCAAADSGPSASAGSADECATADECESPAHLAAQVQLDTEAMLAGMAHARARLGLQEDAAP